MSIPTNQLPADVAVHYELTSHSTRFFVPRLGREVDLTKLTLAEAAELEALPGGFEWLRRREVVGANKAEPVAVTTSLARKKKTSPRREA